MNIPNGILDEFGIKKTEQTEISRNPATEKFCKIRNSKEDFVGIVANEGRVNFEDEYGFECTRCYKFVVLKYEGKVYEVPPKHLTGEYLIYDENDVLFYPVLSDKEIAECKEIYAKAMEERAKAPYHIMGTKYSNADFSKSFPNEVTAIDNKEWTIEASSIDEARWWVLTNYPEYAMGCAIRQCCISGDLFFSPIPCIEYGEGEWETLENRLEWAKKEAKKLEETLVPYDFSSYEKDMD